MPATGLTAGTWDERDRPLGDIGGVVADALQIGGDLQGRDDLAQVQGHGLAQRQHADDVGVDLDLVVVQALVALHDLAGELGVALHHALDGGLKLALGDAAHLDDGAAQRVQFLVVGFDDVVGRHGPDSFDMRTAGGTISRSDR